MTLSQRGVVLSGLGAVCALAWAYTVRLGTNMTMPSPAPWGGADLGFNFVMWAVMMVAMMVPSAAPTVMLYRKLAAGRDARGGGALSALFLCGYLAVWTGFSLLATLAQWALHDAALLSPTMAAASPWLGGGLLLAAGAFQLTPLKQACLAHCRSPMAFLFGRWREGARGAFEMGAENGVYCAGCCWALMALLFVVGVMNLVWVAALAVIVLAEKVLPHGDRLGKAGGLALIAWGAWLIARAS
jgi:predicted metal-binding membrane protein